MISCTKTEFAALDRNLPAERNVVLDPVGDSGVKVGDDPNVAYELEKAAHLEADRRLVRSRKIYGRIRKIYARRRGG